MASSGTGARGMTSLYADLLESNTASGTLPSPTPTSANATTISRAPVVFTQTKDNQSNPTASIKKQISSAARRPQPVQSKTAKKANTGGGSIGVAGFIKVAKAEATVTPTVVEDIATVPVKSGDVSTTARAPVIRSTLEDWATNPDEDDVNGFYGANNNNRQRGGRKRRRKNKEKEEKVYQNWDDIYDPSRPNSYEEYRESEEKELEMRDWRGRLYGRRRAFSSDEEDEDDRRSGLGAMRGFAPPSSYSFAPPPIDNTPRIKQHDKDGDNNGDEDPYERRLRLTQMQPDSLNVQHSHVNVTPSTLSRSPPPPPSTSDRSGYSTTIPPPPPPPSSFIPPPPAPPSAQTLTSVISRAPVRYTLPAAPSDLPSETDIENANDNGQLVDEEQDDNEQPDEEEEEDQPRSNRPGQKGFAERLMSKYGWKKGTGLGADSSGIVQPLHVKVSKGKEKKGTGQIIDKNKKRQEEQEGKFGKMSEVVVLKRMVDGMEDEDMGVLMQEIGDECAEKYGRIERVYIQHRQSEELPSKVFVQFTSQLSGLRAVNALEGRIFNGNVIEARFFDAGKFERRELD